MQACNIAANFDRATAVIMNVPWLSDIYGHELCGRKATEIPKGRGVTYFDTAVAAEHLKCPAYIISGLGGNTCNGSTQMALFNSIKAPRYIEFAVRQIYRAERARHIDKIKLRLWTQAQCLSRKEDRERKHSLSFSCR